MGIAVQVPKAGTTAVAAADAAGASLRCCGGTAKVKQHCLSAGALVACLARGYCLGASLASLVAQAQDVVMHW